MASVRQSRLTARRPRTGPIWSSCFSNSSRRSSKTVIRGFYRKKKTCRGRQQVRKNCARLPSDRHFLLALQDGFKLRLPICLVDYGFNFQEEAGVDGFAHFLQIWVDLGKEENHFAAPVHEEIGIDGAAQDQRG